MLDFHEVAKAIADPQRLSILELILYQRGISCGEIVKLCPVSQATVSHHLKVLTDSGLVTARPDGQRRTFYSVDGAIDAFITELRQRTSR